MMNPILKEIKEFCELQSRKGVEDDFDSGVSWLASIIIDIIAEQEFKAEYPLTYEEQ